MCGSRDVSDRGRLIADGPGGATWGILERGWRGHDAECEVCGPKPRPSGGTPGPALAILGSEMIPKPFAYGSPTARGGRLAAHREALTRRHGRPEGEEGVVANPPYGERIGAESGLPALYSELGAVLRERSRAGRRRFSPATHPWPAFRNLEGTQRNSRTIECRLLRFDLNEASAQRPAEEVRADWSSRPGAQMFANRLRKNLQRLDPWAERERIDCFRVYDAEMPNVAVVPSIFYGREHGTRMFRNMLRKNREFRRVPVTAAARCWRYCPKS